MEELADQLKTNESFTDFLYYEDEEDWEDSIDALDAIETYDSLVFIYIIAHGHNQLIGEPGAGEFVSFVHHCGLAYPNIEINSTELVSKLKDLDSQNIILMVESCYSGAFVEEWGKPANENEDVITMSSANQTTSVRWYGDNGTDYNPEDEDGSAYGGTFTHFFFERLSQGYTNIQSFNYAYVNTNAYAMAFLNQNITQQPQIRDRLDHTWF